MRFRGSLHLSSSGSLAILDCSLRLGRSGLHLSSSGSLDHPDLADLDLASRSSLGLPDLTDLDLLDLSSRSSLGILGQELISRRHHLGSNALPR